MAIFTEGDRKQQAKTERRGRKALEFILGHPDNLPGFG
jgi:hypothetical protein